MGKILKNTAGVTASVKMLCQNKAQTNGTLIALWDLAGGFLLIVTM